jgi:predicted N-acyltransferase
LSTHNDAYSVQVVTSLCEVNKEQWQTVFSCDYPFSQFGFLSALEKSQSTDANSGWQPLHILIYDKDILIAAMPCYLKNHSYGEYIFDWSWADAYQQQNLDYYPKLVTAIPFTPATGPRIGIHPEHLSNKSNLVGCMLDAIKFLQNKYQTSNWQCLFSDETLSKLLTQQGCIERHEIQYHWRNNNYQQFDDFLASLKSRKRKAINKERIAIAKQQLSFKWVVGSDIGDDDWRIFYQYYQSTYLKRSGHDGYLNENFFNLLSAEMADSVLLLQVYNDELDVVASALFFQSKTHLYGRYWGANDEYDFLHFEACYYQGIEYCIKHNLQCFDAGAQGEHKLKRGFVATKTYSSYLLANSPLKPAIEDFIEREKNHQQDYIVKANKHLPFKN